MYSFAEPYFYTLLEKFFIFYIYSNLMKVLFFNSKAKSILYFLIILSKTS